MTRTTTTTRRSTADSTKSRNSDCHFTNQELGQLHRLIMQTHHYLTWCETTNHETDTYTYNDIDPDWTHLNELPPPNETSDDTYNPDLSDWQDIGVIPIDFLADRDDILTAIKTLTGTITNELDDLEQTGDTNATGSETVADESESEGNGEEGDRVEVDTTLDQWLNTTTGTGSNDTAVTITAISSD